jgi:hypothetical protein
MRFARSRASQDGQLLCCACHSITLTGIEIREKIPLSWHCCRVGLAGAVVLTYAVQSGCGGRDVMAIGGPDYSIGQIFGR